MSEAPTVVGSIIAHLKLDASDWNTKLSEAGVKADDLGRKNPSIKVDADVAAALAKLEEVRAAAENAGVHTTSSVTATSVPASGSVSAGAAAKVDAVAAAERRLAAAESASESATARAIVAEMRFEEQRDKHKRTAAQIAAAELVVSEAVKRSENAAKRAIAAEEALAAAQRKAAESALLEAAAQETDTAAKVKANEANSTSATRTGLIVAAVAALLPMMVPLAAFTIGAAGALTMMGVSGVVAIKGIHDEMIAGTDAGKAYSTGIEGLRDHLDVLAHTGAVAMLSSFKTVSHDLSAAMPMLNREVGAFTGFLGRSGANVFAGSLQGARVLEPLMMSISGWVERLTAGFKSWTENGGLQAFANYAMNTLPLVETTLSAVATAVMHILEALAPLGEVGLGVLTGISDGINGIPVGTLSALTAAVLAGWGAFKLWGFVAPILAAVAEAMGAVGVATQIAEGPIGWVTAGVSALIAVFAVSVASAQDASTTMQSYTAAVRADTDAIGKNVAAQAAKNLQDQHAFEIGKTLGLSAKTVLDATLGNTAAIKTVAAATENANAVNAHFQDGLFVVGAAHQKAAAGAMVNAKAAENLNGIIGIQSKAISGEIASQKERNDAVGAGTAATDAQSASVKELADRYGMTTSAYLAAVGSQQQTADQLSITTQAMFIQNDAAGLLKQSLDQLNGSNMSAQQAQNAFDSAIANSNTHVNAAGKEIKRADTLLQGMTASAVANRTELTGQADAAQNAAEKYRGMTDASGHLVHSGEEVRQKLIDMKKAIIDNAVAHGENRKEVEKFVDAFFTIPKELPPTKLEVDDALALQKVKDLKGWLSALHDVTVHVRTANGPGGQGGQVKGSAAGGTVSGPGSAASDTAGIYRLANGEEVVSNMRGQADRYRPMLKAINAGVALPTTSAAAGQGGSDDALIRELLKRISGGGTVNVYPTPGMDEQTIGRVAVQALNSNARAVA